MIFGVFRVSVDCGALLRLVLKRLKYFPAIYEDSSVRLGMRSKV